MQRVGSTGRTAGLWASALATLVGLSACTSNAGKATSGGTTRAGTPGATAASNPARGRPSPTTSTPPAPAVITTSTVGAASAVDPAKPVTVTVSGGTLSAVTMRNQAGQAVSGTLSADRTRWASTETLGYGRTYRITATATNADGARATKNSSVRTVTPGNLTLPYFQTVYGSAMANGATYGVGMITVVHFDEPIPNKTAAERALTVTTTPHVAGAWYWTDNQTAHWRPRSYYATGTKVTVKADVYGVNLGHGLYGESDRSTSFTVGAKHLSVASARTHHVKVYDSGKLVRNMPTSMGRGGTVEGTNGPIYLWTPPGIYTVINHENPAIMSSASYGLPASSSIGYPPEAVYWSTKISTDGIYLHELDTTVWAQGHQNVSHGCLNLNHDNAKWFYNFSRVGDVVQVIQSGGPKLGVGQGGDWSVPWSTWVKGGAAA